MIKLDLAQEELSLLKMLLLKEEATVRVETHHARGVFEYSDYLRSREKEIRKLINKLEGIDQSEK